MFRSDVNIYFENWGSNSKRKQIMNLARDADTFENKRSHIKQVKYSDLVMHLTRKGVTVFIQKDKGSMTLKS